MWRWIASFGKSYNGDVLQYAKQLFSLRLPQMTKYCVMRECDNIHPWISTTGDLAFSHQQEFMVSIPRKVFGGLFLRSHSFLSFLSFSKLNHPKSSTPQNRCPFPLYSHGSMPCMQSDILTLMLRCRSHATRDCTSIHGISSRYSWIRCVKVRVEWPEWSTRTASPCKPHSYPQAHKHE